MTPTGQQITLGTVARIDITDGPPMLKSENGAPVGLGLYRRAGPRSRLGGRETCAAPSPETSSCAPGISIAYSGQYEFLERANARLKVVVPATLLIIFVLLYLTFKRFDEALLIMAALPFALTGGVWFLYLLGYNLSIATGVGFIALAGVAAEFGVVMLLYLKHALEARLRGDGAGARPQVAGRGHPRGRGAAGAPQGHDRGRHPRGPVAHRMGQRHGVRGHEPHRGTDAGRHGNGAAVVHVRDTRGI